MDGQPALVQLQLGADHDDRAARVVHALAEQVLAEAALLALQHVGEGLQRPVGGALHDPLLLGVVEQGVHRLLEHPLLVADDDVGRVQGEEPLQAVVAVDHAAVQVVEVRGGEASAVQLDHGPQLGRDDGDDLEDHPLGLVRGGAELLDQLDALQQALVRLGALVDHLAPQLLGQRVDVDGLQQRADGLGAHARGEGHAVALARLEVLLLGEDLHPLQLGVARVDDDVLFIEENRAQRRDLQVEEQADAGRHRAVVPDVRHGGGQLDVAHALAADLEVGDLDAAAVADHALVADGLELAAVALPFLGGAEDPLAEQPVLLGAEGPVVDRLGLLHLAVGPRADLVRRGELDQYVIEILQISHVVSASMRPLAATRSEPGSSAGRSALRRAR